MEDEVLERLRDNRFNRQQERKRKKFRLFTIGGTLFTAATLAAELFAGANVKPLDVGYLFTSDDVTITNVSDDYNSKYYTVRGSNGFVNNFSFAELEKAEPNVNNGYTYLSDKYLLNGSNLGIKRVENNPVKTVLNGMALMTFIGGGIFVGHSFNEQRNASERRR